jgi:hypothetical protein
VSGCRLDKSLVFQYITSSVRPFLKDQSVTDQAYRDSKVVYAARLGRILIGVDKALDQGWHKPGGPVRRLRIGSMSVPQARGVGLTLGRYLISMWFDSGENPIGLSASPDKEN